MPVRLLIVCGSGIVTSTILEQRIREIAESEDLNITIRKIGISALNNWIGEADLVITTSRYIEDVPNVRIISGAPVISGIGEEKFVAEFVKVVKELQGR
ncbi:MAG: hypothetical protein NUV45_14505 [Tepidanaerobacteraceae bacterium]|jgi:PTS system galactitol-specific IIB component|nr:hypothetical protein [Tepidanaerobacteraceae bacterium]